MDRVTNGLTYKGSSSNALSLLPGLRRLPPYMRDCPSGASSTCDTTYRSLLTRQSRGRPVRPPIAPATGRSYGYVH